MKKITTLLIALMFLASCASTGGKKTVEATQAKKGFLNGYYEKLEPGPEGGAKMRWLKPGADFARYDKVMLDSVVFYLADDSEYKGIDGNEMKELADSFNLMTVNALKDKYPIVSEPGPDVLRVGVAITNLKQSNPGISTITTIIPIGLGISAIKKGSAGSWSGSGATAMEGLAIDSMTNEVLGAVQDEMTAGFTERFSKWGSAKEAFKFWAGRFREFLDNARKQK
jgi:hypothetical protein